MWLRANIALFTLVIDRLYLVIEFLTCGNEVYGDDERSLIKLVISDEWFCLDILWIHFFDLVELRDVKDKDRNNNEIFNGFIKTFIFLVILSVILS